MAHDPIHLADTRAWIAKAESDLRMARIAHEAERGLFEHVVYHCQQAAEKALKGFLTWRDLPFPRTHDLGELGKLCVECDGSLEAICRQGERLTGYVWMFRYPGEPESPTESECRHAIVTAEAVLCAIRERLPPEARP